MRKKEKNNHIGCLNCGGSEKKLPMRTRLYNGFGGWMILKNGELFFMEKSDNGFDKAKTLSYIERRAKLEPDADWKAQLDLPLRSAVYKRKGKGNWVLIKTGEGFA